MLCFLLSQDLPNAMNAAEITDKLGLHSLRNRHWYIQATCATSGDGLYEGLDWLSNQLKGQKWSITLPPVCHLSAVWWEAALVLVWLSSTFFSFTWSVGLVGQCFPASLCCVWVCLNDYFRMNEYVCELSGSSPAVPWKQLTLSTSKGTGLNSYSFSFYIC